MTDVPRLRVEPGDSRIAVLAGALAAPRVAGWDPVTRTGWWIAFEPFAQGRETGVVVTEPAARDALHVRVQAPGVRPGTCYRMCTTRAPSPDRARPLAAGETLELRVRARVFPCADLAALFEELLAERRALLPVPRPPTELPFSAAWALLKAKHNALNWDETWGYYGVGDRASRHQDFQVGWVGGLMNTQPLLAEGDARSRERARRSLDFVFAAGVGRGGFFEPCFHRGFWSGDGFDRHQWTPQAMPEPTRDHYAMTRKSSDALYFALRQLDLLRRRAPAEPIPAPWRAAVRGVAHAFAGLWDRHGQFGQFVDRHSGALVHGGTASAAIAGAALALAAREFAEPALLETARAAGLYYYDNYTRRGLTNGGPGEILQCPDSESAAGLLETLTVLWEETREAAWLARAEHAAAQLASWQLAYDYAFPSGSEFGRLGLRSTGAVFANSQNGHGAPGLCTLSGDAYLKLHRATGREVWLDLLAELARGLPQYVSRADRPLHDLAGRALPPGWINERVNTSDWDDNVGGVFYGGTWAEVSLMLTFMEVPGVYACPKRGVLRALDHVEVAAEPAAQGGAGWAALTVRNPTAFPARVKVFVDRDPARPLGQNAFLDFPTLDLEPGESRRVPLA